LTCSFTDNLEMFHTDFTLQHMFSAINARYS
jgi:hypothetical protein